jgi:hypothetical protein
VKSFLLILLFPTLVFADVGFELGNIRKSVFISGEVHVFCPVNSPGDLPSTVINCRGLVLEPSSYDYFRGPVGLAASEVILTSKREDGSSRSKSVGYDSRTYRSKDEINLWVSTLFQRPLLKEGRNEVSYTLVQNKTVVGQGQFEVLVQDGGSRTCPTSTYNSPNPQDCKSPYSVCDRYFSQYDNCNLQ